MDMNLLSSYVTSREDNCSNEYAMMLRSKENIEVALKIIKSERIEEEIHKLAQKIWLILVYYVL